MLERQNMARDPPCLSCHNPLHTTLYAKRKRIENFLKTDIINPVALKLIDTFLV